MAVTEVTGAEASKQKLYARQMLALLKEDGGNKLAPYCEQVTGSGGSATFYRIAENKTTYIDGDISTGAAADGSVMNLNTNDGAANTEQSIEVEFEYIMSGENISRKKLARTKLSLKDPILGKHVNTINRKKDLQIVAAITADVTAGHITAETYANGSTFADDAVVGQFLEMAAYYTSLGEADIEGKRSSLAIVMNRVDYAKLFRSTKFTSSDFYGAITSGGMKKAFGGDFIIYNDVEIAPLGKAIFLPALTCGQGKSEDEDGQGAYMKFNGGINKFNAVAYMDANACVLDPDAIGVLSESTT